MTLSRPQCKLDTLKFRLDVHRTYSWLGKWRSTNHFYANIFCLRAVRRNAYWTKFLKIAWLFDSVGFLAPFISHSTILLQEMRVTRTDWDNIPVYQEHLASNLFIYFIFHNKDYTSITLYKDVERGPQETTRLEQGGHLVTIILSNRKISTHNNGGYRTHYRSNKKSETFVLNDCNKKIEVIEFGREFQIFGPWNKIVNCLVLVRQAWERKCEEVLVL